MTDSILIVGSGVAGLTAAQECLAAGAKVVLVERAPVIGGTLAAAMTADASFSDGFAVAAMPVLGTLAADDKAELIVLADLQSLNGRAGNFSATISERARFVTDTCTRCNRCKPVCPAVAANEFDAGLTYRKAIYTPLPETVPPEYVIDIDTCLNKPPNYLPCNLCTEVCDDDSIHFDLPLQTLHERQVGAAIIATGYSTAASSRQSRGYGSHPDIVTTTELQRLLIAPGPTGGFAARPSNEEYPHSIILIIDDITAYSVDTAMSLVQQLASQDIERIVLLITVQPEATDIPAGLAQLPGGTELAWGLLREIEANGEGIKVSYADFASNRIPEEHFDMVVLDEEPRPASGLSMLAGVMGVDLTDTGYVTRPDAAQSWSTSRAGIYVAGGSGGPVTLTETVRQAKAAALAALGDLDPRLLRADYEPGETASTGEPAADDDELRARIERALYAMLDD